MKMTNMTTMIRTYSELIKYDSFEDRFRYLKLDGLVGEETFGYDRILNQVLYKSDKWRKVRDKVIVRDEGNDLGTEGYPIGGHIIVHHMNPITVEDVLNQNEKIFSHNIHTFKRLYKPKQSYLSKYNRKRNSKTGKAVYMVLFQRMV